MPNAPFSEIAHAALMTTPVASLLDSKPAVVLERIARGGGATRWYYCQNVGQLGEMEAMLRPGSEIRFYFDGRIALAPYSEEIRTAIGGIIATDGEALIGELVENGPRINMELVSGPDDLMESLSTFSKLTALFYGRFPARDNDGLNAVSLTLPDADGMVRPHPH